MTSSRSYDGFHGSHGSSPWYFLPERFPSSRHPRYVGYPHHKFYFGSQFVWSCLNRMILGSYQLHLKLNCSKKEISVENITTPIAQYLDLGKHEKNIFVVRNWAYLTNYTHFQYTESWHQVDSFKFVLLADRPMNH